MPRFFIDRTDGKTALISGNDAKHIAKSLRMTVGEELTVCDCNGFDFLCDIEKISADGIALRVKSKNPTVAEPKTKVTLYQALPKGEKMEFIIQKCVELGIYKIVPIISHRTVSRPDEKSQKKKRERWQKIALEAAKQSGRGIIPQIDEIKSLDRASEDFLKSDRAIIFYEGGGEPIKNIISKKESHISVMIGCEGGFDREEVENLTAKGAIAATLGRRILRCETAPIVAISNIMLLMGEFD